MKKSAIVLTAAALMIVISTVATVLIATGGGNDITDQVIAPRFEAAEPFRDGYAVVMLDGKYGAINEKGEFVVEPRFAWLGAFNEGYAAALNDAGEMQIVAAATDTAITPTYTWRALEAFTTEYGEASLAEVRHTTPVERSLESVRQNVKDYLCFEGIINLGGIPFHTDGTPLLAEMGSMDAQVGPCVDGVIPVRWVNDAGPYGVGLYNKSGEWLGDVVYGYLNMAYAYAPKDGRVVFSVAEMYTDTLKVGLLDAAGRVIVEPIYDNYRYSSDGTFFRDGLMIVQKDGKYGAINLDGEEVIACVYEFLGGFNDGYCFARKDGEGYFIDPQENRYAIGGVDGAEVNIAAAAYFNAQGIGVVYDSISDRTYCIRNILTDGMFTAIPGTERLDIRSFIPDYVEGEPVGSVSGIADNGLFPYEKDGKWGYLRVIVEA